MKKTRLHRRIAGLISLLALSLAPLPALHAAGEVNQASGQESKRILELETYKGATAFSPMLFGHNLETTSDRPELGRAAASTGRSTISRLGK